MIKIVKSDITSTTYAINRITFLDSLQGDGTSSVDSALEFLQWLAMHKIIVLDTSNTQYDMRPTAHMIRQRRYRPPGSHPDTGTQIYCDIYFFLMVLPDLRDLPLPILTPFTVHQFRAYLAHFIVPSSFPLNICDIIQPSTLKQHTGFLREEPTDNYAQCYQNYAQCFFGR